VKANNGIGCTPLPVMKLVKFNFCVSYTAYYAIILMYRVML
jgi:hypothetical protein